MYDVRKIYGFFNPLLLVTVTNLLILFLSSAFWGPPHPTHCGRHILKSPISIPHSCNLTQKIEILSFAIFCNYRDSAAVCVFSCAYISS